MSLCTYPSLTRDIPHERRLSEFELAERQIATANREASIRRSMCQEFLAQHDEAPDPSMFIAPWFCAEADRIQNRPAPLHVEREERNREAAIVGELLAEVLDDDAPMDVLMAIAEGRR